MRRFWTIVEHHEWQSRVFIYPPAAGVDFLLDAGVDATIRYDLALSCSTSIKLSR